MRYASAWEPSHHPPCAYGPFAEPVGEVKWILSINCEAVQLVLQGRWPIVPTGSYIAGQIVMSYPLPSDGELSHIETGVGGTTGAPFCGYAIPLPLPPEPDCFDQVIKAYAPPIGSCTVTLSTPEDAFE